MNRLILLFTLTLVSFVQSSLNNNNVDKCCCPSFKESKVQVLRNNGVITIIQNPRYSSINDYIATRENDAGHNQRIKEFGSLITPEIKTKVSQVFSVYGIKPRLVSIVINKKGNIEATEWIFHEKEDSNSISDNCAIEAFFNLKDILAFPAWKEGTPHEMISFSVFYGISHCQIRPLHCQDGREPRGGWRDARMGTSTTGWKTMEMKLFPKFLDM